MKWKDIFTGKELPERDPQIMPEIPEPPAGEDRGLAGDDVTGGRGGVDLQLSVHLRLTDESQVGRAALLLASTTTSEEEASLKKQILKSGWRAVATEVGGLAGDLPQKITRAVVGAALNSGVVEKKSGEMHALMHAALEAMNSFISMSFLEASIGAKIGIVRNHLWVSVAVVGDSAYHAVAHHERCGLGVMHL
ncbi:MAG: HutP family protein [Thermovirgaceae bacterium]